MEQRKTALKLLKIASNHINLRGSECLTDELKNIANINFEEYTDDKDVLAILMEYELYKPEKMAIFLMESLFAALDSISSQIETIKVLIVRDAFAMIRSIEDELDYVKYNPSSKNRKYIEIQKKLSEVSGKLKENISILISQIRDIDRQDWLTFFLKSGSNKKTIDTNIRLIRQSIDALENVVGVQLLIARELDDKNTTSILDSYKRFYNNELLVRDTCILLQNYEFKEKDKEQYFLKLSEKIKHVDTLYINYGEYIQEYSDVLNEYEDIVFES